MTIVPLDCVAITRIELFFGNDYFFDALRITPRLMHKYIRSRCNYLHRTTNHPLAEVTQHPMRPRKNTKSLLWERKANRSLDLRIPSNCRTTEPITKPLHSPHLLSFGAFLRFFGVGVADMESSKPIGISLLRFCWSFFSCICGV